MALILTIHRRADGLVLLAICDNDLLGKTFSDGKRRIDFTGGFYRGEETSKERVSQLLAIATHVNMAGKEAVSFGIETENLSRENIITICGIPYGECVIVRDS